MEGLRQISQVAFDSTQKFNRITHSQTFESLVIIRSSDQGSNINRGYLVENELCVWTRTADEAAEATLRLVCLNSEPDTSLNVSKDIFSAILLNVGADPSVLYMICHTKDGFHYFPGSTDSDHDLLPTWFVGTSRYAVLWTFDATRCVTSGIMIERARSVFKGFSDALGKFADCIYTPHVMCFAIPLYQLHFYDARVENALNEMRAIEKSIGFGPRRGHGHWQRGKSDILEQDMGITTFTIDDILTLSQKVHEVAGKIKNSDRLRRSSARMLETILLEHHAPGVVVDSSQRDRQERYKATLEKLSEAVPVLQRQMDANADYLAYMQYRAENLSQVIIALLTHEDAAASIDLATASKKDTSSMKTIAIMTMIFLPATFFAALFSVLLLEWDQPRVMHKRFWIYWAFTIPSTTIVFIIWLLTAARKWTFVEPKNVKKVE